MPKISNLLPTKKGLFAAESTIHLDVKKVERQKELIYEKEQREMKNCTFTPKLNKTVKIRKPEASILVQNFFLLLFDCY